MSLPKTTALAVEDLSKIYQHRSRPRSHNFRDEVALWLKGLFTGVETDRRPTIDALRDVSFELKAGDILGLVGRNGAGKSTLLKILAGIIKPSQGRGVYRGRLVSILELGAGFHPDLTGRENIFLNGGLLGMSKDSIRARFDDILAFSELEEFIDQPVKHYSSGMYLRLAFSVFAHLEADILLLDEVIAVGDLGFRLKSYKKIIELANRGTTIVVVSHDPDQVKEICNKCLWLDKGRVMAFGATGDVLNDYLERYLIAEAETQKGAVVSDYQVSWPAGLRIDDELNVRHYSLKAKDKPASEPKRTNDDLEMVIEFEKLKDGENIEITFTVLSLYGTWVLADSYGRLEKYHNRVTEKGAYRCVCTIPAGVLNFGIYQVGFLVSKAEVLIYQNPCLMNFKIEYGEEEGVKPHIARKAASLIKPLGVWEIKRM